MSEKDVSPNPPRICFESVLWTSLRFALMSRRYVVSSCCDFSACDVFILSVLLVFCQLFVCPLCMSRQDLLVNSFQLAFVVVFGFVSAHESYRGSS